MTGIDVFLNTLADAGVQFVFGNPGSTELPLNDALAGDSRFRYILGLHEIPTVSMADGYALASGRVGVANVHIACGLGNAMGMLYNAHCEGAPILLTAGQQDQRLLLEEPVLAGDLATVARPWTKWSYEVRRAEDMATATRRAIQTALTPPTGPVFLSLPLDVQMAACESVASTRPTPPTDRRLRPSREALEHAADLLLAARKPAILAGGRATEAGAADALAAVAERLGCPVFGESATSHGRLPIPADHPLYRGALPLWAPDIHEVIAGFDVLFVVGMNLLRLYIYREPARPIPDHVRLIQLDNDPWQVGKNYPVEVGLIGDPQCGLEELASLIDERQTSEATRAAQQRTDEFAAQRAAEQRALNDTIQSQRDLRPMTPLVLMQTLGQAMPADTALIAEAPTTHQYTLEKLGFFQDPAARFAHRGWALGWGAGCALGVKLAWPDRPVLALLGDGSTLYGIQALWTAAHDNIPVTFVVPKNREYKILKTCAEYLGLSRDAKQPAPGMDLVGPEIDYVGLGRALGVDAHAVSEPEQLVQRVRQSLDENRPTLVEVPIAQ